MATVLYIIATLILFFLNLIANLAAMGVKDEKGFPLSAFIATIFTVIFIVWGISLLVAY